jgi:low affinity Fe/Cu permease
MDFIADMTTGAMFFYGGLAGLGVTFITTVIIALVQTGDRKKLHRKLDEEYGR